MCRESKGNAGSGNHAGNAGDNTQDGGRDAYDLEHKPRVVNLVDDGLGVVHIVVVRGVDPRVPRCRPRHFEPKVEEHAVAVEKDRVLEKEHVDVDRDE